MLRNYFVVAVRNLLRHKVYSAINVVGLAAGMACCILVLAYVREEFRVDRVHGNGHRIYRVLRETRMSGSESRFDAGTSGPISPAMIKDFPEVEAAARIVNWSHWFRVGDKQIMQGLALADASVLGMFGYTFARGNPVTALSQPGFAVVSESAAMRCFGEEDPIGKTVTVSSDKFGGDYTVTGVLRDAPEYAHLQLDFVTAFPLPQSPSYFRVHTWDGWRATSDWRPFRNYVMLREGASAEALEKKLPAFIARHMGDEVASAERYYLQPLERIHLYSTMDYGFRDGGDIYFVSQISAVALFILLIACANFTNLAAARAAGRAREVGIRKASGATRSQLGRQFLGESLLLSLVSLVLALTLADLALPIFNDLVGSHLSLHVVDDYGLIIGVVGIGLITGMAAGFYPALLITAFRPVQVLKGALTTGTGKTRFRRGLVVLQFVVCIVLVIGTTVVRRQTNFMKHKSLGYNRDQLVVLSLFEGDLELRARKEVVKQTFLRHPSVLKASACWPPPGSGHVQRERVRPEGAEEGEWEMQLVGVDEDLLETYEIDLVQGRNFDRAIASDRRTAFILNESAVKALGWTDPVGRQFQAKTSKGHVIGVMKDFHVGSVRGAIQPTVLWNEQPRQLAVRIAPDDISETVAFLEERWKSLVPDRPFSFHFLDEQMQGQYWREEHEGKSLGTLAMLAILVACLGLLGLASFMAELRAREIGIRKAVAATAVAIAGLLVRESVLLVVAATLIASPIAYYAMNKWLQDFAYRIPLGPDLFLFGGALALASALLSVAYQALRAAIANPVDALRHE